IVSLVCIHQSLHKPMYIFIAALSINSVLFSTNIYPKLLIDFLSEKQVITYQVCYFQGAVYYTLMYSEFALLAAMAYDRYVAICKPLQYATVMRKATVGVFLVLSWLVPACETTGAVVLNANSRLCRFTLRGIFCNNTINYLYCVQSKALSLYGMVMLFNVAVLPVLFILFTYTRILIISYRSNREVRTKAAHTCVPHLLVLTSFSCFVAYDVIVVRIGSDIPKTARLIMTLQVVLYHPLFNPIIYGLKMKEISKHIEKLLCQVKSP
ncbi:olfactory receptor 2AT4-like, partial [Plectropomus leopardus]|uniref:olfactory receptor 2AT4-like n=1 Tax=Plectropomus leopardus TaxID=160734 RepID=UPI001C4C5ADC